MKSEELLVLRVCWCHVITTGYASEDNVEAVRAGEGH